MLAPMLCDICGSLYDAYVADGHVHAQETLVKGKGHVVCSLLGCPRKLVND